MLNRQRLVIYDERRRVLEGEDIHEQVREFLSDTVSAYVRAATAEGYPEDWDLEQLWTALGQLYPVGVTIAELEEASGAGRDGLSTEYLVQELTEDAQAAYDAREEQLGAEVTRELERRVILSVLDRKWREHLYEMDYLRDGIGLRAMAQRDPLIEYQREGYELFTAMMDAIKEETVGYLFHVEVQVQQPAPAVATPAVQGLADATGTAAAAAIAAATRAPAAPAAGAPVLSAPGLGPARPQHLEYTAPNAEGGIVHDEEDIAVDPDEAVAALGADASRAERRRAARAARKRK